MPLNLLKTYNSLLELDSFNESERYTSLSRIFYRDFIETTNSFRDKAVKPTPQEGKTTIEVLFHHPDHPFRRQISSSGIRPGSFDPDSLDKIPPSGKKVRVH